MKFQEQHNPPGDRTAISTMLGQPRKRKKADIEGYQQDGDNYYTDDESEYEDQTGQPANAKTRQEAILELAKAEGIQNPEGDLEQLLEDIKKKRKKKSAPDYESPILRPGL